MAFRRPFPQRTAPGPARTILTHPLGAVNPAALPDYFAQLLQQRQQVMTAMASGVSEIEAPGIGHVQYVSVEERAAQLAAIDRELQLVSELMQGGRVRRRPIHPCAIE